MKFKIDENLPLEVADLFNQANYNAMTVLEENLSGATDAILASICQKELRVLITLDTDFAYIRNYPPKDFYGIIVLRVKHQDKNYILKMMTKLIRIFD
jgi:predicted nuclease of predicted toxin-antitoxin system